MVFSQSLAVIVHLVLIFCQCELTSTKDEDTVPMDKLFAWLANSLTEMDAINTKYWGGSNLPDNVESVPSIIINPLKEMTFNFKNMMKSINKDSVEIFMLYCDLHNPFSKVKLFSDLLYSPNWLKHDAVVNDSITFESYYYFKQETKEFLDDLFLFYSKGVKSWLLMKAVCESLCKRPSNEKTISFYLGQTKPFITDLLFIYHDMKLLDEAFKLNNKTLDLTN